MDTNTRRNMKEPEDPSYAEFMGAALKVALRGWGTVNPNPLVGAVIVKEGKIVSAGYHKAPGCPHAEIEALESARRRGIDVTGCTLYVNLEPCSHYGRTPPCVKAIIEAGIGRVAAAMEDPNPLVAGRGFSVLRENGIVVIAGIMENEAKQLNEIFIKYITSHMPFVLLKAAMTLDGKTAALTGDSRWISCNDSRALVHRLRSRFAAVMAGCNTIKTDDPLLTSRLPGIEFDDIPALARLAADEGVFASIPVSVPCTNPARIIVDSDGCTDTGCNIIRNEAATEVIIATTGRITPEREELLKSKGVRIIKTSAGSRGYVDLRQLMHELYLLGFDSVMVEGGGNLNASALECGIVDKVMFFIAPRIAGGRDSLTPVEGMGVSRIDDALVLERLSVDRVGCDILVEGYPEKRET